VALAQTRAMAEWEARVAVFAAVRAGGDDGGGGSAGSRRYGG